MLRDVIYVVVFVTIVAFAYYAYTKGFDALSDRHQQRHRAKAKKPPVPQKEDHAVFFRALRLHTTSNEMLELITSTIRKNGQTLRVAKLISPWDWHWLDAKDMDCVDDDIVLGIYNSILKAQEIIEEECGDIIESQLLAEQAANQGYD